MPRSSGRLFFVLAALSLLLFGACTIFSSLDDLKGGSADGKDSGNHPDTGFVDASCFGSCALPNALKASCINNRCVIEQCKPNYEDCDGLPESGCEANLQNDAKTCGSCDTECKVTNGTAVCNAGKCGVQCLEGTKDCNGTLADGCEAVPGFDGSNCGDCGTKCQFGTACANGSCQLSSCPSTNGTLVALPVSDEEAGFWSAVPGPPFFADVDDFPNDDALGTYIWDDTQVSQSRALFNHATLTVPNGTTISNLVVAARAALSETATVPSNLWLTLRLNTSLYDSSLQQVPLQSFQTFVGSFPQNPMTQAPWQPSDLADVTFGVAHRKPIQATNPLRVTQILLEVCLVP